MPTRTAIADRAPDGRLLFTLAAVVLGLSLVTMSLLDRASIASPILHESASSSSVDTSAEDTITRSLAFTARRNLTTRRPDQAAPTSPARDWSRLVVPIQPPRARKGANPYDALMKMAALQRHSPQTAPEFGLAFLPTSSRLKRELPADWRTQMRAPSDERRPAIPAGSPACAP